MKILSLLILVISALWLSGCTIQSDSILPTPVGTGDAIEGFPSDSPFRLETFDRGQKTYKPFAIVTPVKEQGGIRYTLSLDDSTANRLEVQARRMSDGNYLLRYTQSDGVRAPTLEESGIAFISADKGTYYLLSSITKEETLQEIFPGKPLPREAGSSNLMLETDEQAVAISAWFGRNFQRLAVYKEYSQFRVVR